MDFGSLKDLCKVNLRHYTYYVNLTNTKICLTNKIEGTNKMYKQNLNVVHLDKNRSTIAYCYGVVETKLALMGGQ